MIWGYWFNAIDAAFGAEFFGTFWSVFGGMWITNTSVNPARSTGQALFVGDWAMARLWIFWLAPLVGGVIGGLIYRWLGKSMD